jgi:uncharacterized membrane protein YukC
LTANYNREWRIRESYKVVRGKSGLNRFAGLLFNGLMEGICSILGIINKELKIINKRKWTIFQYFTITIVIEISHRPPF